MLNISIKKASFSWPFFIPYSMEKLLEFTKRAKIDFTKTVISSNQVGSSYSPFKIKPKDFFRFAKEDFKDKSSKGLINSISNAKRAIDCQIDSALVYFGIDFDSIHSASAQYIERFNFSGKDIPHKLKLVQAIGLAPSFLVSNIRGIRNKLEHYYEVPTQEEVERSIELAELFILTIEGRLKMVEEGFFISSTNHYEDSKSRRWIETDDKYKNRIDVSLDTKGKKFNVNLYISNNLEGNLQIQQDEMVYYGLIYFVISISNYIDSIDGLQLFLQLIKHPLPMKNISIANFS